jgi:molybdopterin molybdotransferase
MNYVQKEFAQFDQARSLLARVTKAVSCESVPLSMALGRVAGEDIFAEEGIVPYARSAMDGYALRAADTINASPGSPLGLPLLGRVLTGEGASTLAVGTAMGIATGAPVPANGDAVVPYEHVTVRDGLIFVEHAVRVGNCIFPPEEDVRCGEILLNRGTVLRSGLMALLAFAGRCELLVYRRPIVSILCTGSELVDIRERPACGQIRNSNAYSLAALLSECGTEARYCGTVTDNSDELRSALEAAREGADILITTGGASVGERDLVKAVLEDVGVKFEFRQVAIRPGKPFAFGWWGGLPVCALPGNPAAAFVCFQEFVRPTILRMAGREKVELPTVRATLRGHAKSKAGFCSVLFGNLRITPSGFLVEPLENQCSGLVRNPAMASGLIVLPEGAAMNGLGDQVTVQVVNWDSVLH